MYYQSLHSIKLTNTLIEMKIFLAVQFHIQGKSMVKRMEGGKIFHAVYFHKML